MNAGLCLLAFFVNEVVVMWDAEVGEAARVSIVQQTKHVTIHLLHRPGWVGISVRQ